MAIVLLVKCYHGMIIVKNKINVPSALKAQWQYQVTVAIPVIDTVLPNMMYPKFVQMLSTISPYTSIVQCQSIVRQIVYLQSHNAIREF